MGDALAGYLDELDRQRRILREAIAHDGVALAILHHGAQVQPRWEFTEESQALIDQSIPSPFLHDGFYGENLVDPEDLECVSDVVETDVVYGKDQRYTFRAERLWAPHFTRRDVRLYEIARRQANKASRKIVRRHG